MCSFYWLVYKNLDQEASKAETLKEAFTYPLTTVPLSIVETCSTLRQGDKAGFRNFLIKKSDGKERNTYKK